MKVITTSGKRLRSYKIPSAGCWTNSSSGPTIGPSMPIKTTLPFLDSDRTKSLNSCFALSLMFPHFSQGAAQLVFGGHHPPKQPKYDATGRHRQHPVYARR